MPDTPSGPGRLARRWANWAGNLLVSAIVLVVALTLGREVVHWWHAQPLPLALGRAPVDGPASPLVVSDSLGWPDTSEELRFGELPFAFGHGIFVGSGEQAVEVLRRECDKAASQADAAERLPGAAETKLLARLQKEKPVSEAGSRWSTYIITRPVPMAVAVSGAARIPADKRRVLAWGILFPEHQDPEHQETPDPPADSTSLATEQTKAASPTRQAPRWGWFTWRPSRGDAPSSTPGESWPVVPEGQRTMSIRTVDGGVRLAYHGTGSPDRWREAFDQWFRAQGWEDAVPATAAGRELGRSASAAVASQWQKLGSTWSRRYQRPARLPADGTANPQVTSGRASVVAERAVSGQNEGRQEAEIQVLLDRSGTLRAVLIVSPSTTGG